MLKSTKRSALILATLLAGCLQAQAALLLDFGATATSAPDSNGNYWNNFTSTTISGVSLVDHANTASGVSVTLTSTAFGVSGGPAQGAPDGTVTLPFEMPSSAYTDYFFLSSNTTTQQSGTFTFSGLNPGTSYNFYIFSSRGAAAPRLTTFAATGSNFDTATVESGANLTIETLTVTPDGSGNVSLLVQSEFANGAYTFSYLNAIEIQAVPEPSVVGLVALSIGAFGLLRRRKTVRA